MIKKPEILSNLIIPRQIKKTNKIEFYPKIK